MTRRDKPGIRIEAVKVALDPTPAQGRALASAAGAARFCYNACLAHVRAQLGAKERPDWDAYSLRRWWNASKDVIAPWWRENSKEAYSYACSCLAAGFKNYSDSRHGRRKGRKVGFPRFKKKGRSREAFAITTGSFGLIGGDPHAVRVPKVGRIHCMEDVARRVAGRHVTRMTVSRRAGRWFASLSVETPVTVPAAPSGRPPVGIDLGVKRLATLSDGTVVANPKYYERAKRALRHKHRALSRKQPGSKRRAKAKSSLQKAYARVASQRRDAMQKLTCDLVRTYGEISIEDLNVSGMVRNHRLAARIEDASFYEFRRELECKCPKAGVMLHVIDRWYPSSKTCSRCGAVKGELSLSERTYRCDACGLEMDRDLNAAINILVAGSAPETSNARGASVRPSGQDGRLATREEARTKQPERSDIRLGAAGSNFGMQTNAN